MEGYLHRWSESRHKFVQAWFSLHMGPDGPPPHLAYAVREDAGAATTPRSILKVSGRPSSPDSGSIPVDEIRTVRMGFEAPPATDSSRPNCDFQLTCGDSQARKLVL
eukprot:COSAG02_NODE_29573_length_566_cov_7.372591_1_plen_106_part_01